MKKENITFSIPSLSLNIREISYDKPSKFRDIHFHNAVELVKVNKGKLFCIVNDEEISILPDDVILINSGLLHKLRSFSPIALTYMQIDIDKYLEPQNVSDDGLIYEFIRKNKSKIHFVLQKNGELKTIFDNIKKEAEEKSPAYLTYIKSNIIALSGFMQRNGLLTISPHIKGKEKLKELSPAIAHINENYNQKLSLDDIAKKINADRYRFCRLFKSATGSTAFEYINFVRIHNAKAMLISTKKSVSDIAFDCGFASIQYFNRVFKSQLGYTPKDYKNQFAEFLI